MITIHALKVETKNIWNKFLSELSSEVSGNLFVSESAKIDFSQSDFAYWLKRASIRKHCNLVRYSEVDDSYKDLGIQFSVSEDHKSFEDLPIIKCGHRPCLFLDRDGVINEDDGYTFEIDKIKFLPNVFESLKRVSENNIDIVILTNQSGIGRGFYKEEDVKNLHAWMEQEFIKNGIKITSWFYCPYHPDGDIPEYKRLSPLRKPGSAMGELAFEKLSIDPEKSLMVGDKVSDKLLHLDLETWFIKSRYELGDGKVINDLSETLSFFGIEA